MWSPVFSPTSRRQQAGRLGWLAKPGSVYGYSHLSPRNLQFTEGERGSRHLDKPTRDPGGREMRKKRKRKIKREEEIRKGRKIRSQENRRI